MPAITLSGPKNGPSGRPRFKLGDEVMTNDHAPAGYRSRRGRITEIFVGTGDTEYRVEFEDGLRPTTGYLMAKWLER